MPALASLGAPEKPQSELPRAVRFVGRTATVSIAALVVAVALPGADHLAAPTAPWRLLGEPLGGTWLALMTLLLAGAVALVRPRRLRALLASGGGTLTALVTSKAAGLAVAAGRLDGSTGLATTLGGDLAHRSVLLLLCVVALGAPIWGLGRAKTARVSAGAVGFAAALLALTTVQFLFDGLDATPLSALADSLVGGQYAGDRVAALWVLVGLVLALSLVALNGLRDDPAAAEIGAWSTWAFLIALPLISVALFAATSDRWAVGLDALKYALALSTSVLLAASGLASLASPTRCHPRTTC